MDNEVAVPAFSARIPVRTPALGGVPWHDKFRSDQTTTEAEQALDE